MRIEICLLPPYTHITSPLFQRSNSENEDWNFSSYGPPLTRIYSFKGQTQKMRIEISSSEAQVISLSSFKGQTQKMRIEILLPEQECYLQAICFKGQTQKMRIEMVYILFHTFHWEIVSKVKLRKWGLKLACGFEPHQTDSGFKGQTQKMRIEMFDHL